MNRFAVEKRANTGQTSVIKDLLTARDANIPQPKEASIKEKITRMNIDSRHRNRQPANILESRIAALPPHPFYTQRGSTLLTVHYPGNNLSAGDNVVLTGVVSERLVFKASSLQLQTGSAFVKVTHPNHGMSDYSDGVVIAVSGVIGNVRSTHLANIPVNLINRRHQVVFVRNNLESPDPNAYYVDVGMTATETLTYAEGSFVVQVLNVNGVPLNMLNANYPVDHSQLQGFHTVVAVGHDFIQVRTQMPFGRTTAVSLADGTRSAFSPAGPISLPMPGKLVYYGGGHGVSIARIVDVIEGYPTPSHYKVSLRNTFHNVTRLRLVSSEIPNTEKAIKDTPVERRNNLLHWQNLLDGDVVYEVAVTPGNYTAATFAQELTSKITAAPRRNTLATISQSTSTSTVKALLNPKHAAEVVVDVHTNVFKLRLFSETVIERPLALSDKRYTDGFERLIINHPDHFLEPGDAIGIADAVATHGVPASMLNDVFTIETVLNTNAYEVKLRKYNPLDVALLTFGGTAVTIKSPIEFRLLMNRPGSVGSLLGFRSVGEAHSVTPYTKEATNQMLYEEDTTLNSVGQDDSSSGVINLQGDNYILMTSPIFVNSISSGNIEGSFAKLQLAGNPGSVLFNHYVQIQETLPEAVTMLSELEFMFITPSGHLFNFNNQDHSFTVEVHERLP